MYAIFWRCENGFIGNGQHVLSLETLESWLSHLRRKYPNMEHWGEDETGKRQPDAPNHLKS